MKDGIKSLSNVPYHRVRPWTIYWVWRRRRHMCMKIELCHILESLSNIIKKTPPCKCSQPSSIGLNPRLFSILHLVAFLYKWQVMENTIKLSPSVDEITQSSPPFIPCELEHTEPWGYRTTVIVILIAPWPLEMLQRSSSEDNVFKGSQSK